MNRSSSPVCIGIIMDGNRRWAKEKGLPTYDGHAKGYSKFQEVVKWVREAGVSHIVVYAFSTENWNRSKEEVGYLMSLFRIMFQNDLKRMANDRVRVRFVGDKSRFDTDMQKMMEEVEAATNGEEKYDITLHLAMSYGGRGEIVAAARAMQKEGSEVTEESFAKRLWSYPMPDPDIIIRTGGEKRLSGFLAWQSVYSELFFVDSFWPAFTKAEFDSILAEFAFRERRRGK